MPPPVERPQSGSFAIDPGQFAQAAAPSAQGPVITPGSSITGSLNLIQNVPQARGDSGGAAAASLDVIFKLGGAVLQPYIEQEAQAQFMSGVRKAMEGQALKEIVDEQPWYTNIFGPANAAEGARFYTAQTRIAEFQGEVQARMPEFAQQGPEALQNFAMEALKAAKTGDPTADALITKEYLGSLAPAFKQQAKESYILQQKRANQAQAQSYTTGLRSLDLKLRAPAVDDADIADRATQVDNFIAGLATPDGQRFGAQEDNLFNAILTNAAEGNVTALGELKNRGVFATLPADRADTLQRALVQGSLVALNRELPKYAVSKAQIEADQAAGVEAFVARRKALNELFAKETGITEVELFPSATMDNSIRSIIDYNERARAAQAVKLGKEAAARQEQLSALTAVDKGGLAEQVALGVYDARTAQLALTSRLNEAMANPEQQGLIAARNPGVESATLRETFGQLNAQPEYNTGFERAYRVYKGMSANKQAVDQYLNAPQRKQMEDYDRLVQAGTQPADAYQLALRVPVRYDADIANDPSGARSKALLEAATAIGQDSNWYNPFSWGKTELDTAGVRMLARAGQRAFAFGGDPARNALAAITDAQKLGFQKYGTRGVLGLEPANPDLYTLLKRDTRDVDTAFDGVITETATALGIEKLDDYDIIRMPDSNKKARFLLSGVKPDGSRFTINFTSDDIEGRIAKAKAARGPVTTQSDPMTGAIFNQ